VGNFSEEPGSRVGVGTIDYQIFIAFYFPAGVVDSLISYTFIGLKPNLFVINHPCRKKNLVIR
jgi:hypothetical protein